jgi:hypothetical protein
MRTKMNPTVMDKIIKFHWTVEKKKPFCFN